MTDGVEFSLVPSALYGSPMEGCLFAGSSGPQCKGQSRTLFKKLAHILRNFEV